MCQLSITTSSSNGLYVLLYIFRWAPMNDCLNIRGVNPLQAKFLPQKWSFQAFNKLLRSPVDYSQCIRQAWAKVGGVSTDWLPLPMAPLIIFKSLVQAHDERSKVSTCPNPTKLMALTCNDWAIPTRRGCRHLQ